MSDPKKYEYVSDGYTARFLNPQTGHAAPKGEYVSYEDYSKLRMERIYDINQMGGQCEEIARLKEDAERYRLASLQGDVARLENARLKAEVERLKEDNRQLTNAFEIAEGIIKRMGKAAEAAAKEGKPSV